MALFEGIGRVADYAQLRNLRREMKYRIKTGQSLAEAMGKTAQPNKLTSSALQKTQKADANREAQIRQKLRQGQKLSATDKQYLKDNNPDLYEKVARIEERREALARALRNAKTKDEAQRAVAQANIAVLSEMKSGGGETPSFHGMGGGSAEGGDSSAMTAGGGMGDALDAPIAADEGAAPRSGEMQGALGRDALAAQGTAESGINARTGEASGDSRAGEADEKKEGFQPGPATRDQYGNRRVLSPKEMDDMLRQAQESGKLSPLDNEKVYLLRALQREWMEYANSEEFKNLPNTALDAAEEEMRGVRRKKHEASDGVPVRAIAPNAAAVFTAAHRYYHAANGGEPFEAKG
ncbi:hypothetical protein AXF19_05145 [Selenomonas sp. oral taxon 126]|uniref:hypothetical protein n=1 Tax=Selenomonas sp. oral taxon 126 TaxID=712528 RepID=UPI0008078D44|nr:hypothetical protein [Selenomonas sp. oral taxon 126]ANR70421.1 hypothetical protein AXF19_05145 [Selenomonas sp. oral taxon 126]